MVPPRVWLITGASSGFGRTVAELALSRGDIVVATLRKPEVLQELSDTYSGDRLLVLKLDVTNQADIDHAFERTKEVFGRLDVVFNNAGYAVMGDAESTPINSARALFEVNYWGAINVTRAAIRFFREVNEQGRGGILLQNSSISGVAGAPGLAFYSSCKHGLDGFSEALAGEILPEWNIKICIINPGGFHTSVVGNGELLPLHPAYKTETSPLAKFWQVVEAGKFEFPGDPVKFAREIYSLVDSGSLPLHLPIGQDALGVAKQKVESLGRDISEAEPRSADLLRDNAATVVAAYQDYAASTQGQ